MKKLISPIPIKFFPVIVCLILALGTLAMGQRSVAGVTWTETGSMADARFLSAATLLPNGKVLVTGGGGGQCCPTQRKSAELYDPASGTWSATGFLRTARQQHTATLLFNGKVLVAGGFKDSDDLGSAELYDPARAAGFAPAIWPVPGPSIRQVCFLTARS
jgi:hypothetical protein